MPTTVNIRRHHPTDIRQYDWFTRVELPADGLVVADGIAIDARGMPPGRSIAYIIEKPTPDAISNTFSRQIFIQKSGPNTYQVNITGNTRPENVVPADISNERTVFPSFEIWPSGQPQTPQTITGTYPGSWVVSLPLLKIAARTLHAEINEMRAKIATARGYHPSHLNSIIDDYTYNIHRGVHVTCARIGHEVRNLTLFQRITFCWMMLLYGRAATANDTAIEDLIRRGASNLLNGEIVRPTFPIVYTNPRTFALVPVQDMTTYCGDGGTGPPPSNNNYSGNNILKYNGASTTPGKTILGVIANEDFNNAGWIDSLNA